MSQHYYLDEEDCLGFKVWVAELELMVGNARGKRRADPRQAFQLLQKLAATLDRTGRLEVSVCREWGMLHAPWIPDVNRVCAGAGTRRLNNGPWRRK